jgi:hypothetical protein
LMILGKFSKRRWAACRSDTARRSRSVAELTEGVPKMMLLARLKTAAYCVAVLAILFGAGVLAQQKEVVPDAAGGGGQRTGARPRGRQALTARKALTFHDFKPGMVEILREHGSLEVQHVGKLSVRVVVETLEDLNGRVRCWSESSRCLTRKV